MRGRRRLRTMLTGGGDAADDDDADADAGASDGCYGGADETEDTSSGVIPIWCGTHDTDYDVGVHAGAAADEECTHL